MKQCNRLQRQCSVVIAASASLYFAIPGSATAQDVSACNPAIVKDNMAYSSNIVTKLAFLQTLSKEDYMKMTDNRDINVTLPIDDVPVKFDGNWEHFQEQRNKVFSQFKYDFDGQQAIGWATAYLSPLSPEIYRTCIEGLRPVGTHIWMNRASPTSKDLVILFAFYTAPTDTKQRKFEIRKSGGEFAPDSVADLNATFTGPRVVKAIFNRASLDNDVVIIANTSDAGDIGAADLEIPAMPKVYKLKHVTKAKEGPHSAHSGAHPNAWGNYVTFCTAADDGFTILRNPPPYIKANLESDASDQQGSVTSVGDQNACAQARVKSTNSGDEAGGTFSLIVTETKPEWVLFNAQDQVAAVPNEVGRGPATAERP